MEGRIREGAAFYLLGRIFVGSLVRAKCVGSEVDFGGGPVMLVPGRARWTSWVEQR